MLLFLLSGGSALVKVEQGASLLWCTAKSVWRRNKFVSKTKQSKNKAGIQRLLTGPVSRRLQFPVKTVTTSGLLTTCVEHKEDLVSPTVSSSIST